MDRSVPPGAAILLDFIGSIEAPHGYDTVYGNNQDKLAKPLSTMKIGEVIKAGPTWTKKFGSSAAGRYQFMRNTLTGLCNEVAGLSGSDVFDGNMQDRLAYHLLKRRGYSDFMAGKISMVEFGKRLAQEWASFPVLAATTGSTRALKRGQSYYAGDGLNNALVSPQRVEDTLRKVKATGTPPPRMPKAEMPEEPKRSDKALPADRTDSVTVEIVQRKLWDLGYTEVGSRDPKTGAFDGKFGKMTKTAILAFRNENDLAVSDVIDDQLLAALDAAAPRRLNRSDATTAEVRQSVPEVRSNWLMKMGAVAAGVPAAIGGLFDGVLGNLNLARGYVDSIKGYMADVPGWVWLGAVVVVAGGAYLVARHGEAKGVEAYQEGARR